MTETSATTSNGPLPAHLRDDGPFAALLQRAPTGPPTRERLDRFQALTRDDERLLTAGHLETISAWVASQTDSQLQTAASRHPEMWIYVRQRAAAALVDGASEPLSELIHAAMVMGASVTAPQDESWRYLLPARQLADALFDDPRSALRDAAIAAGPAFEDPLEAHSDNLVVLPALALVLHQPTGVPMLERPWSAALHAQQVKAALRRLQRPSSPTPRTLAWGPPGDRYLPTRIDSESAETDPIAAVNRYLRSGRWREELLRAALDEEELTNVVAWAQSYWDGPAEDAPEPPAGLVLVSRAGAPQLARVIHAASAN